MAWHVFEKLLEEVANQSSLVGRIWITSLFMFRLIVVASIGDHVYSDEQSAFRCNTLQPGCENICFNHFSPISQIRFWAVQILFVGTPSVIYIIYALPKLKKAAVIHQHKHECEKVAENEAQPHRRRDEIVQPSLTHPVNDINSSDQSQQAPPYEEVRLQSDGKISSLSNCKLRSRIVDNLYVRPNFHEDKASSYVSSSGKSRIRSQTTIKTAEKKIEHKCEVAAKAEIKVNINTTPELWRAYLFHVVIRTAVEGLFLYLQYDLYKFHVSEVYVCEGFPCPRVVECFVSRPKEKTLFLLFMYATSILSLVLNVAEVVYMVFSWMKRCCCRRKCSKTLDHSSSCSLPPYTSRRVFQRPQFVEEQPFSQNTFPRLGPFPRTHTNSFGESSDGTIDSDYRFYDI